MSNGKRKYQTTKQMSEYQFSPPPLQKFHQTAVLVRQSLHFLIPNPLQYPRYHETHYLESPLLGRLGRLHGLEIILFYKFLY